MLTRKPTFVIVKFIEKIMWLLTVAQSATAANKRHLKAENMSGRDSNHSIGCDTADICYCQVHKRNFLAYEGCPQCKSNGEQ